MTSFLPVILQDSQVFPGVHISGGVGDAHCNCSSVAGRLQIQVSSRLSGDTDSAAAGR